MGKWYLVGGPMGYPQGKVTEDLGLIRLLSSTFVDWGTLGILYGQICVWGGALINLWSYLKF